MKWIIDRFEGDKAVIEYSDGKHFELPRAALPEGAKEGDVLAVTLDADETEARQNRISSLRKRLFVD